MIRKLSLVGVSLMALAAAHNASAQSADARVPPADPAAPTAADPQEDPEPGRPDALSDIVVTATRQSTNLQSTPITITAVTSEALQARGLSNAADLGDIIPNAAFERSQGVYGPGVSAFIRGIGQHDTSLAQEPAVAFYVDDVYYPLLFGSMFDLLELDHVEVLRGPQGTLFGRNALAGAINLVSKKPNLDTTTALVETTIGSFDRRDFRASLNLPISDTFGISVSAVSKERTGYQRVLDFRCEMVRRGTPALAGLFPFSNPDLINGSNSAAPDDCTIGHQGGEDSRAMRGQLYWEPQSNLSLTITADYLNDESDAPADSLVAINSTTSNNNANTRALFNRWTAPGGPTFAFDERFITGNPYTTYATYGDPVPAGVAVPGNTIYNGSIFRGGVQNPTNSPFRSWGVSSKLIYGLTDEIDLTVIGGYREIEATYSYDVDATPVALENNRNDVSQSNFSGEIRLTGSHSWVDWVAGLFYYEADGEQRFAGTSSYNNTIRYQSNKYTPVSKAAYVNATFRPMENLGVTVGGRYSDDTKPVDFYSVLDGTTAASTQFTVSPTGSTIFQIDLAEQRFDWKLGLDYQLAEHTMVFASAATGFRLPGFNARPFQASQVQQFPGEEILTYELGVKSDLFDRRLRVNATAFYTDYKTRIQSLSGSEYLLDGSGNTIPGTQIEVSQGQPGVTVCQNAPAGTTGFQCVSRTFYINIPGKVQGVEFEVEANPIDGLSINASLGYSNFSSADLDARPDTANKKLLRIPDWTASAGIQYEIPNLILGGTVTPRIDWLYMGDIVNSITRKETNQDGYSLVNARIAYHHEASDVDFALGVTNLFDKFYYRNYFVYQDIGFPHTNAQPAPPREWSLTISRRF